MNLEGKSPGYLLGVLVAALSVLLLIGSVQAWVLGIILGWFGVHLSFWKCFVIMAFVSSIVTQASSK